MADAHTERCMGAAGSRREQHRCRWSVGGVRCECGLQGRCDARQRRRDSGGVRASAKFTLPPQTLSQAKSSQVKIFIRDLVPELNVMQPRWLIYTYLDAVCCRYATKLSLKLASARREADEDANDTRPPRGGARVREPRATFVARTVDPVRLVPTSE